MKTIHKIITGYAYPKNGNNPHTTPRVRWEVREDGRVIDSAYRLRDLKRDHPTAVVVCPHCNIVISGEDCRAFGYEGCLGSRKEKLTGDKS